MKRLWIFFKENEVVNYIKKFNEIIIYFNGFGVIVDFFLIVREICIFVDLEKMDNSLLGYWEIILLSFFNFKWLNKVKLW